MAGITKEDLRREITAIFKDADLSSMSAKKLRQQLEKKLDVDLSDRKKEVDEIMMECLEQKRDGKGPKESKKRKDADDDDEEEEEEEEEDEEEKKGKRTAAKKKPPPKKQKKGSSDESDEGSDDNASDEEYNPGGKKGKGGGAKKGGKGKKKAKGSDSDDGSDEDWSKSNRGGGGKSTPAKKGPAAKRGGGGGGYTKALNLTPELAALVGCESMARHEVVKKIWAIIKGRNLFDPKNKQFAICDDELLKVFGVKRFRTFGMMKYLKNHFID